MDFLQNNLQTPWKCLIDRRLDFVSVKEIIDSVIDYIISRKEQKEWYYFDAKGKWKDDDMMLWRQYSFFGEKTSGMMMSKLWKWYMKFKSSNFKFKKLFLENSDGYIKIDELSYNFTLKKSETSLQEPT
jgi:hypothetical protein